MCCLFGRDYARAMVQDALRLWTCFPSRMRGYLAGEGAILSDLSS
ncbi:hypothetical protein LINPERPRIM_LOCUS33809 [Linum perenne]